MRSISTCVKSRSFNLHISSHFSSHICLAYCYTRQSPRPTSILASACCCVLTTFAPYLHTCHDFQVISAPEQRLSYACSQLYFAHIHFWLCGQPNPSQPSRYLVSNIHHHLIRLFLSIAMAAQNTFVTEMLSLSASLAVARRILFYFFLSAYLFARFSSNTFSHFPLKISLYSSISMTPYTRRIKYQEGRSRWLVLEAARQQVNYNMFIFIWRCRKAT